MTGSAYMATSSNEWELGGLNLPDVPSRIMLFPRCKESGGAVIGAGVVDGTITADGCTVFVTGAPPVNGYQLTWMALFN